MDNVKNDDYYIQRIKKDSEFIKLTPKPQVRISDPVDPSLTGGKMGEKEKDGIVF